MGTEISSASYVGFTQKTQIFVLPSSYSNLFERFCELNKAPCNLVYRSQLRDMSPEMASLWENVRKNPAMYFILENSEAANQTSDLAMFLQDDVALFYIGSNVPLEEQLLSAGIPLLNFNGTKSGMPLFKTSIPCLPVGPFSCGMVVSMHLIPKKLVEQAVVATAARHGAPIHIGDPAIIGIEDINRVDCGKSSEKIDDLVPMFWASSFTMHSAVRAAGLPYAFSNNIVLPEMLDSLLNDYSNERMSTPEGEKPCVVPLRDSPFVASLLSENSLRRIRHLEQEIQEDIGNRGIQNLHIRDELVKAALVLSHARSVAVHFGFPCNAAVNEDFPDETDGPLGAVAVAKALLALGKEVTMISSHYQLNLVRQITRKFLKPEVPVMEYRPGEEEGKKAALDFLFTSDRPIFDAFVAIEAVGRTLQGRYMTMAARDLSEICTTSPVDELFLQAHASGKIYTIGIGDGGNEIGMGKVHERVVEHIKNGEAIATMVPADYIITAGVSNWGGSALAVALFILNQCPVHSRHLRRGIGKESSVPMEYVVNTVAQEEELLSYIMDLGVRDGICPEISMSVDGKPFKPVHADKLRRLLSFTS